MIRRALHWWFGHRVIDFIGVVGDDDPIIAACTCGKVLSDNETQRIWAGQL